MRRSRKPLNLYGFREFESHPHRQLSKTLQIFEAVLLLIIAEFETRNCSKGARNDIRNSPPFHIASPITTRSSFCLLWPIELQTNRLPCSSEPSYSELLCLPSCCICLRWSAAPAVDIGQI